MFRTQRPLVAQTFRAFPFVVGTAPLPILANANLEELITTFIITTPATAANSVFLGNAGVAIGTGLELLASTSPVLRITQARQLYELQAPLLDIEAVIACREVNPEAIPLVVWDLSKVFLVTGPVAVTVTIATFPEMYI